MGKIAQAIMDLHRRLDAVVSFEETEKFSNWDIRSQAIKYFAVLRPLSHGSAGNIPTLDGYIKVGSWVRESSRRDWRGSSLSDEGVFQHIVAHGDKFLDFVRRPILEPFANLVKLARQLKFYQNQRSDVAVRREVDIKYEDIERESVTRQISSIEVDLSHLNRVKITYRDSTDNCYIRALGSAPILEEIIDPLIEIYKELATQAVDFNANNNLVTAHNVPIFKEMERIVIPVRVVKVLAG